MKTACWSVIGVLVLAAAAAAAETNQPPHAVRPAPRVFDPYFLGYETEPSMDCGGRSIASAYAGICRFAGWVIPTRRVPFLAPLYEWPLALLAETELHEIGGHGGRAREFHLDPYYGFASTGIHKDPENNAQLILIAGAGTEAASLLAHRLLQDLYAGDGSDAAKIPLLFMAKTDYTLYCLITPDPGDSPADFRDEYTNGNDIAFYVTSRQAQRRHADPVQVWNGDYTIDFSDPLIQNVYNEARAAALWNMLDPAFLATCVSYWWDHVIKGRTRVHPPVIPLGSDGIGFTASTRAFLGSEEVTRFLDLYLVTPGPLFRLTGRDLASSIERTYGVGAGVTRLKVAPRVFLSLSGDVWKVPANAEGLYAGTGWNVCSEINTLFADHIGFSLKVGGKSQGYFPGTPIKDGIYGGGGVQFAF